MFSLLGLALGAKIFGFLTGIYRNIGNGEKVTLETMLDTGIVFYREQLREVIKSAQMVKFMN